MMLVQLPAMDAVQGLSLSDSLLSWASLSGTFTIFSHLGKPSVLLTLLASLVILSSIRAALLYMRPLPPQKGSVSLVQSVVVEADKVVVKMIKPGPSPALSTVKGKQPENPTIAALEQPPLALCQSDVPVSMAKMIMSRHTFRRPTSRPPPVRTTSAPQYQRRMPSMV